MRTHPTLLGIPSVIRSILLAVTLAGLFSQFQTFAASPVTSPPRVLVLDEMVTDGANSAEVAAAQLAIPGVAVDVVAVSNWPAIPATGLGGPTGFGFDSYRAIILGEPICMGTNLNRGAGTPEYLSALNVLTSNIIATNV
jgi:hypothetical protein